MPQPQAQAQPEQSKTEAILNSPVQTLVRDHRVAIRTALEKRVARAQHMDPALFTERDKLLVLDHEGSTRVLGRWGDVRAMVPANIVQVYPDELSLSYIDRNSLVPDLLGLPTPERHALELLPDRKLVVNADNGRILSTMGSNYAVVSHRETADALLRAFPSVEDMPCILDITDYGLRMDLQLITREATITPKDGYALHTMAHITNSLNGSTKYKYLFRLLRWICLNGLCLQIEGLSASMTHSTNIIDVDAEKFRLEMEHASIEFHAALPMIDEMIDTPIRSEVVEALATPLTARTTERARSIYTGSILAGMLGVGMADGFMALFNGGDYHGYKVPGTPRAGNMYQAINLITGLAHTKAKAAEKFKAESASNLFRNTYAELSNHMDRTGETGYTAANNYMTETATEDRN